MQDDNKDLQSLDEMLEEAEAEELEAEDLAATLEATLAERDELKDRLLRAFADSENMRKRADRDRREAENYGGSKLARDMLPVYDNLTRALEAITDEQREANAALIEGIDLTMRELVAVFARHGIKQIAPAAGDKFDPQQHEAMFEAPVPGTKSGEIIQVMQVGFMLHDRLLRAAKVGVSSTPA
ncbi:nucleotide exchange factor GrpE [Ketogulonicigenium vulgare]|uniref:Protein GrpE n=1 Tax=Ketogulonicigenium vulgare (strain WSH-001) TaxID=759362 RepID=F9Y681_KETVW|nr:nucleotide exchange factor GrpE [Ketogulonicigenium vulgare]ADO43818.1 GrpE protein HSP-70 cofactor, putative [Ketogulonicigenium vulgare Y25]AEM42078.1 GrpE protein HSP-70 cofactor, putative [Ketogulonicigenium vulgare WSH-001]ALJ82173.1 molecular chaperone GrpE [Ketogulonicigenium vulgare]ANW34793.1 nucleotide exchange factor GrpE [Ketogulonicigenium vulgare]AOZ55852.1 GrpE protein HSP-70 cofactor [Ketogulonicigenium vulgare]